MSWFREQMDELELRALRAPAARVPTGVWAVLVLAVLFGSCWLYVLVTR